MPYLTTYQLKWDLTAGPTMDDVSSHLRKNVRNSNSDSLQDFPESLWKEILQGKLRVAWYNHQMDMATIVSARWPEVRFELHGNGEDDHDLWAQYFQDQMIQRVQGEVVYPPFDPEQLTEPTPPAE